MAEWTREARYQRIEDVDTETFKNLKQRVDASPYDRHTIFSLKQDCSMIQMVSFIMTAIITYHINGSL